MKKKNKNIEVSKKELFIIILSIILISITTIIIGNNIRTRYESGCKIEWVEVEGTAIEQHKLYIKDAKGKNVSGIVELTTIAGKKFEEKVNPNGSENIYIKSVIKSSKIQEIN